MNHSLNVSKIEIEDLEGDNIVKLIEKGADKKFSQIIGNTIFKFASSIELSDKSRIIHEGKTILLTDDEKTEVIEVLKKNLNYIPIVMRAIESAMQPTEVDTVDELETAMM